VRRGSGTIASGRELAGLRDLPPRAAAICKDGLLFKTRNGTPHLHGSLEARWLTERLKVMGLDEPGMGWHAFRRFRKTWLRGKRCQEDINNFWMGHKPKTMAELYSRMNQRTRTHLSLDKDTPILRKVRPPELGKVVDLPQVGGGLGAIDGARLLDQVPTQHGHPGQKPIWARPRSVRSCSVARPLKSTSKSMAAKSGAEHPWRKACFCFGR